MNSPSADVLPFAEAFVVRAVADTVAPDTTAPDASVTVPEMDPVPLDEALRGSSDQRKLHVVPVGADGVVYNGPSLDGSVAIGCSREDHAVGGFPYGNLADVADAKLALTGAESIEREVAESGGVSSGKQFEIAVELALEAGIDGADAEGWCELDDAD